MSPPLLSLEEPSSVVLVSSYYLAEMDSEVDSLESDPL